MLDVQKDVSLAGKTTFHIGGKAKFFAVVQDENELRDVLEYAGYNNLDYFILGGGSNVLFSDKGFDGLVIKINNPEFLIHKTHIEAGAGVPFPKLVRDSIAEGLSGMEWAAGIPGTIGGAVRGNAGAFGQMIGESVESVKVFDILEKKIKSYAVSECEFGYRDSLFKRNKNLIILSVKFKFVLGDKEELERKRKEIIEQRISKQPQGMGSAGSFFMNPVVDNEALKERFEKQKGVKVRENKLPAGWLIDQAELKGKKIGNALVSETHADFILNAGGATAEDVIILEGFVKQQVRDKFGVQLQSEVEHVGF